MLWYHYNLKQGSWWKDKHLCPPPPCYVMFCLITDAQGIQLLSLTRSREHRNVEAPVTTQMTRLVQDSKDQGVTSHVCMCDFDAGSCRERGKNKVCQDWHSIQQRLCKPQTFTLAVCIISPKRGGCHDCQAEYESKRHSPWLRGYHLNSSSADGWGWLPLFFF